MLPTDVHAGMASFSKVHELEAHFTGQGGFYKDRDIDRLETIKGTMEETGSGIPTAGAYSLPGGIYSVVRPVSMEQEIAEEKERVASEFNLSVDEVEGPEDETSGVLTKGSSPRCQSPVEERKNWAEFGYDLDYVETPDEVVSQASSDALSGAELGVGGNLFCRSTLNLMNGLNQFLVNKQNSSNSTTTTTVSSRIEHSPVPTKHISPPDIPPQVTFDEFLSDEDDDVANIWNSNIRGLGVAKSIRVAEVGCKCNPARSASSDSSEHEIKEHGSTICRVRTRTVIWFFALILCVSLLVACISLFVIKTMDRVNDRGPSIEIDDYEGRNGPIPTPSPPVPATPVASTVPATSSVPDDQDMSTDPATPETPTNPKDTSPEKPVAPSNPAPSPVISNPTHSPTTAPTSSPTLAQILSAAPTPSCRDRDNAEFVINGIARSCTWLREMTLLDFQISICRWNVPIRQACRLTCNTCDAFEPTISPTIAPAPETTVTAQPTTNAPTIGCPPDLPGPVPGEAYTCSWLSQTNGNYQASQCAGGPAWYHCLETCGNCQNKE